jgi:transposase
MSTTELRRAGILARVAAGTLKLGSAATLMEVNYRQAKRLYRRYRAEGAKGLKHRSAGRASNRATEARKRKRVLGLIREKYSGGVDERFGPTLAAEHLASEDGITVDHETLRRWMLAAGLWSRARHGVRIGAGAHAWRISASWCSSMAVSIRGSKTAARRAVC